MSAPALSVENLNCSWGELHVIHDVSFSLDAGETMSIFGLNGAGKSTLIHGLINDPALTRRVDTLELFGDDVRRLAPEELVSRKVGVIPQEGGLFGEMTVRENLEIPYYNLAGESETGFESRLEEMIDIFPQMASFLDRTVRDCSGGERKMTMITKGLITSPDLLLVDEPTAALSPNLRKEIMRALAEEIEMSAIVTLPLTSETKEFLGSTDRYLIRQGELEKQDG